jgi:hypothetical protein
LAWSFQANPALSQATLVSGWLELIDPVISSEASCSWGCQWQTLAWSFQANPALSQATLVSGWLELIDPVISSEASCSWGCQWQTLAWSFQANPALSQATLVSGWLSMSVARASSCHDTRAEASTTAPMTDFMIDPLPPTKSIAAFDST